MTASLQHHALGVTWSEPSGMMRAAHALHGTEGGVWLIDPFEDAAALQAAASLGEPAGVIQLLDRHNRDCQNDRDAARSATRAAAGPRRRRAL